MQTQNSTEFPVPPSVHRFGRKDIEMLDRKITVEECCVIVGCGKSHCYGLLSAQEIDSWTIGRKRVVSEAIAYAFVAKKKAAEIAKQRADKDGSC